MIINGETCIGCNECHAYCPVEAIGASGGEDDSISRIDQDLCVECGVCVRAEVCPTDAIYMPDLQWPRLVREAFSNPKAEHRGSREMGRGTEEMKTNDVTGLFPHGVVGMALELGRPGVSTSFRDVQTMAMALAKQGVTFATQNPVTSLMTDSKTGELEPEVLDERALSAIIEFIIPEDRLGEILETVRQASRRIDTVFALDLIRKLDKEAVAEMLNTVQASGFSHRLNNKTNIGLGRPLKTEG